MPAPPPIASALNSAGTALTPWLSWFRDVWNALPTNYTKWTPSIAGGNAMTISLPTIIDAKYTRSGPRVDFKFQLAVQLGGTASGFVMFGGPVAVSGNDLTIAGTQVLQCGIQTGSTAWQPAFAYVDASVSPPRFIVNAPSGGNFPLGFLAVVMSGSYRVA